MNIPYSFWRIYWWTVKWNGFIFGSIFLGCGLILVPASIVMMIQFWSIPVRNLGFETMGIGWVVTIAGLVLVQSEWRKIQH